MLILAVGVGLMILLATLLVAVKNRHFILYSLAGTVSIVGINVHVGGTIYLSRLTVLLFLIAVLVRAGLGVREHIPARFLTAFVALFALILAFQLLSTLLSNQVADGLRQVVIYVGTMVIFTVVIVVADSTEAIVRSIKVYLVTGIIQGFYGLYQVVGKPFGWPTYQRLMAGIPTANDRTLDGYVYSGSYDAFRASGFFPADVSHYAGYMVGVLLLAIAFVVYDRRRMLPYAALLFGTIGLLFSLSRSGILAFVVFGLPTLLYLLSRIRPMGKVVYRTFVIPGLAGLIVLGVAGPLILKYNDIKLPNVSEILGSRLVDLLDPGSNRKESMSEHLETRLAGLDATASSPLIGVGLGVNASPWYSDTYQRGWAGSHSHHLDILGQTGVIGAGLQFLLMALVGVYMWRGLMVTRGRGVERHVLAGVLASYVAILFGNFMYSYFLNDFVWFLMAAGVALSRLMILEARKARIALAAEAPIAHHDTSHQDASYPNGPGLIPVKP